MEHTNRARAECCGIFLAVRMQVLKLRNVLSVSPLTTKAT